VYCLFILSDFKYFWFIRNCLADVSIGEYAFYFYVVNQLMGCSRRPNFCSSCCCLH